MKKLLIILFFTVSILSCKKDNSSETQSAVETLNEKEIIADTLIEIKKVIQLPDQGYLMSGSIRPSPRLVPYEFLTRYNKLGKLVWRKIIKDVDSNEGITDLIPSGDNEYLAYSSSVISGEGSPRFLYSDLNGNLNVKMVSGGFIGKKMAKNGLNYLLWGNDHLRNVDSNGKTIWEKTFPYAGFSDVSTNKDASIVAISVNNSGNVKLIKLSSSGDLIWQKPYYGSLVKTLDDGYMLAITGETEEFQFRLLDPSGNPVWSLPIFNAHLFTNYMGATNIFIIDQNHYVFTYFDAKYVLQMMVMDREGRTTKTITYPYDFSIPYQTSINKTSDNGLVLVRSSPTNFFGTTLEIIKFSNVLK